MEEENGCRKVRGCKPSINKIWEVYGSMVGYLQNYQNLFLVYVAGTNELYIISRRCKRLKNNTYILCYYLCKLYSYSLLCILM